MPFGEKSAAEDVEALVDTLTIDGATLNDANLTTLSSTDIQQLAELSQDLHFSNDMETEDSEVVIEAVDESSQQADEEENEIGTEEIEIETEMERVPTPEEILPDVKVAKQPSTTNVPPLRPLNIAPKPLAAKMPIAMKPMPGQQLLLLGSGGNQAIKLVSSQGQELSLGNFQLGRPVTLKQAGKTLTTQGNISLVQPKQVVMKKIITSAGTQKSVPAAAPKVGNTSHIMVVQKSDQMKLLPNQGAPSPTKTITLQQAQELGLITTKLVPQAQSTPKQTVLLNKGGLAGQKTIKIVPQQSQLIATTSQSPKTPIKSPTKILPATQSPGASRVPQKIIFKTATSGHTILPSAQIIQVAGTQALSTGQLHQINIPGKGMQYIKFVTASSADTMATSTASVKTSPGIVLSDVKQAGAAKPLKTIAAKSGAVQTSVSAGQVVMLPTFVTSKVPIPMRHATVVKQQQQQQQQQQVAMDQTPSAADVNLESNGMRPRKPCNCTKSQCLKLYCDCFANGEFCFMCNCMNCFNNLENEDNRQRAIKTCLERNPHAFRPKIGKAKDVSGDSSIRKHTKGCNCKRSGCLKNYCECYEAKIACSNNCKCVGCRNIEDSLEKKVLRAHQLDDSSFAYDRHNNQTPNLLGGSGAGIGVGGATALQTNKLLMMREFRPRRTSSNSKQAINFINDDVIEATVQCMLTISHSGESNMQDEETTKGQIIEEFGRCLKEIIDCTHN